MAVLTFGVLMKLATCPALLPRLMELGGHFDNGKEEDDDDGRGVFWQTPSRSIVWQAVGFQESCSGRKRWCAGQPRVTGLISSAPAFHAWGRFSAWLLASLCFVSPGWKTCPRAGEAETPPCGDLPQAASALRWFKREEIARRRWVGASEHL